MEINPRESMELITLLIEYLKAAHARSIMSSLNDSTCNLNYKLQRNLVIG